MTEPGAQESPKNPFSKLRNFVASKVKRQYPSETVVTHLDKDASIQSEISQLPKGEAKPEVLKPAERIYFHATPLANYNQTKEKGLFGQEGVPTLGESLGYSLFFAYRRTSYYKELGGKTPSGDEVRNKTPDDWILTIWKDPNKTLQKRHDPHGFTKYLTINTEADESETPESFLDARLKSGPTMPWEGPGITEFSSENMAATIPLNKNVRDVLLEGMVMAHAGRLSANEIESKVATALQQAEEKNPDSVFIRDGKNLDDLVHDLVSSFERELVEDVCLPTTQEALNNPEIKREQYRVFPNSPPFEGNLVRALFMAELYKRNVNEPNLLEQLDRTIEELKQKIVDQGENPEFLEESFEQNIRLLKNGERYHHTLFLINMSHSGNNDMLKYYSYNPTFNAAYSLIKELGIHPSF